MKPFAPIAALLAFALNGTGYAQTNSPGVSSPKPVPLDLEVFVLVESGDLPIVLSAPHGGEAAMIGIAERTFGTDDLDENTLELAMAIQKEFTTLTGGKKAYLVAARVSRRYVDFNRAASQAYESDAVASVYNAYHEALRSAIKEAKGKVGSTALLIDIHGQSDDVTKVYRGTQDGQTADLTLICQRTPAGLISTMEQKGLPVRSNTISEKEPHDYNGGYIVRTSGLKGRGGINAVQFEFGHDFRDDDAAIAKAAKAFAEALVAYLDTTPTLSQ